MQDTLTLRSDVLPTGNRRDARSGKPAGRNAKAAARAIDIAYTPAGRASSPVPAPVTVMPALDINLGTVQFPVHGDWHRYWYHEPRALELALSRAVRPPRWDPSTEILTVNVAATGNTSGNRLRFAFTPASRCLEFLAA